MRREPFADFWPDYLAAHSKPATRACHYLATAYGVGLGFYGFATLQLWPILAAIAGGYVIAVGSHYLIEGRQPLVKRNAFYGACADFRMIWLALTGRLRGEYARLGIPMRDNRGNVSQPARGER